LVTQDRSRFFLVFHHSAAGSANFYCHDVQSNQTCPGYPRITPMGNSSSRGGMLGGALIDENDKIYFNAWNNSKYGISCWDAMSDSDCGYIELGSHSRSSTFWPPIEIVAANDKIYAVDESGTLHCVNKDLSLCGGVYPKLLGGNFAGNTSTSRGTLKYDESHNKLYFLVNQNTSLACWNINSSALCSGWNQPISLTSNGGYPVTFFTYTPSAEIDSVCIHHRGVLYPQCVSIDDPQNVISLETSISLNDMPYTFGADVTFINELNQAVTVFAGFFSDAVAYNWTTGEKIVYNFLYSNGLYAPFIDSAGCIWFAGDNLNAVLAHRLDSNVHPLPSTTADGCKAATASGVIEPINNYCSTGSAVVTNWDSIVVNNITASD
ncbi:hypothetical protein, partial [Vibrio sagamiensis]|uniref:hypothetical protein n=2 Tax=Vibrio sagamiensis TaxID=512650 RepID=UPI001300C378